MRVYVWYYTCTYISPDDLDGGNGEKETERSTKAYTHILYR